LQRRIGYADGKSAPAHFYVQTSSLFNWLDTPIPFNLAVVANHEFNIRNIHG
jgi:hypothetical protein